MKVPSCGVTFVLLHVGHLILAFSLSEMVMVSSNGFSHFSHMNSYLGMAVLPDEHLRVHRVLLLGPVERQGDDAIRRPVDEQRVHHPSSSLAIWPEHSGATPGPGGPNRAVPATPTVLL